MNQELEQTPVTANVDVNHLIKELKSLTDKLNGLDRELKEENLQFSADFSIPIKF
jgi:hypothetical protein